MPKTNLDILEDLLYKVGKMSEDDVGVVEFEVFSELIEKLRVHPFSIFNIPGSWLQEKHHG
jgi:hypothetical protein|tara:strand:+ start:465 stop:647 length:183 start_codon:yes stop_codon:yes gene_type:complete